MGGGYDIICAYMISQKYKDFNADIGGWLNPKFVHYFEKKNGGYQNEKAINIVESTVLKYRRKIDGGHMPSPYQLVDGNLSQLIKNKVVDFSILKGNVESIVFYLESTYEKVIFCDVGGDIFFLGKKDNMVKTPIIDAMSLKISSELCKKRKAMSFTLVLGIGFDGELPFENINSNIAFLYDKKAVIYQDLIYDSDLNCLEEIYNLVRMGDEGKTIKLLIEVGKNEHMYSPLAIKRDVLLFSKWFGKILFCDSTILSNFNPLVMKNTYEDMLFKAHEMGISMERYKLNGQD